MIVAICKFCGSWVGVVGEGSGGGSWVWVNVVGKKKYRNKELKKKVVKFLKRIFVKYEVWVLGTFKIGGYSRLGRLDKIM